MENFLRVCLLLAMRNLSGDLSGTKMADAILVALRSHLPSSFFSQPSALTRIVPRTKHPRIAVKFHKDVPATVDPHSSRKIPVTIYSSYNLSRRE